MRTRASLNGKLDCNLVAGATAVADRVRDELARDKQGVPPRLASHTGGINDLREYTPGRRDRAWIGSQ